MLTCNDTGNGTFVPFLGWTTVEVLDISLERGHIRVMNFISFYCYDATSQGMDYSRWHWDLTNSVYALSNDNKFVVIGCRTLAFIGNVKDMGKKYMTGCAAMCPIDGNQTLTDMSCSGMGCCQAPIPPGLQYYEVFFDDRWNTSAIHGLSPCSYAVLMESSNLTFSETYVTSPEFNTTYGGRAPMVLDWFIPNKNCQVARTDPGYACVSSNSECVDTASGQGYICNCKRGFRGNPYVKGSDGCQDINECDDPVKYGCHGSCANAPGTFKCFCPRGTRGNASAGPCQKESLPKGVRLGIGIFAGIFACLVGFLAIEVVLHRRSIKRQALHRQSNQYFQQHGGQLLSQMLRVEGNDNAIIFYEREDIVKATANFDKANIIGEGAQGTVYKATLYVDGIATTVAVKRCKEIDENRKTEFLQELVILCRVSHPNIVKLLGCCLQLEAPVLVYEFARNGTLQHLLHGRPRRHPAVSLATRLRIAVESSRALAHLHNPPHQILHGDVKPANILLGDGWVVKVSDFGCSTIDDSTQVVPKGTMGYLDPEFLYDFQLTKLNDVYSFGVLLIELLTGKKPLVKERKNLTAMLHESLGNGTLDELLDTDIVGEGSMRVIHQAVELASRCIAIPGETRPTMQQVAEELWRLSEQVPERAPPPEDLEGRGFMDTVTALSYGYTTGESETTGFYGLESNAALSIEYAR